MTAAVREAVVIFAGTNVDDLVVLAMLFVVARAPGGLRAWHIWAGQYAGIAVLAAASLAAVAGLLIVPLYWAGLAGVVPLALGIRRLAVTIRGREPGTRSVGELRGGLLTVAGLTVSNGADNISVYVPIFRTIGWAATAVTLAVFAVCVALWCVAGAWLASHKKVAVIIERYGMWIVPGVYILIGVAIIVRSGLIGHLT